MRRVQLLTLALLAIPATELTAQSSQFGVRGLGLPGRAASARALGTGGALGLFDGESSLNPAALWSLSLATTSVTTTQSWRTSINPGGEGTARDNRFPQFLVGGPIPKTPLSIGISYSTYADRDFTLATAGTASPRGVPIGVIDTLSSTGGINDIRVALAWGISPTLQVGAAVHALTGSNRLASRRVWEDTTYLATRQTAEVDYLGFGVSVGAVLRPVPGVMVAGTIRRDGSLDVRRDSLPTATIELPWTLAGAVRVAVGSRLDVSAQISTRDWSVANDGLVGEGAVGARNTIEYSAGLEFARNARRRDHLPLRVGIRSAQLPFLLAQGTQPKELGISVGTALRFANNLAGVDLALERIRRTQGDNYRENAWLFSVGISVRSGRAAPLQ
jgi:hypothetical protein